MSKKKKEETPIANMEAIRSIVGKGAKIARIEAGKYHALLEDGSEKWFSTKGAHHNNYKPKEVKAPQGLGDVIESVTEATGIKKVVEMFTPEGKDCGCDKRKEKLNKLLPAYRPNCMTKKQYDDWTELKKDIERTQQLTRPQQEFVIQMLRDILNMNIAMANCSSCGGKTWLAYIQRIDKVYETYE